MELRLRIISPNGTLSEKNADSVSLPGSKGGFQVLRGHAPLISSLDKGEIVCRCGSRIEKTPILSGFVEVKDNVVTALVEV